MSKVSRLQELINSLTSQVDPYRQVKDAILGTGMVSVLHSQLQQIADKSEMKKEVEDEMRRKLARAGFQENQIEAIIHPKKAEGLSRPDSPIVSTAPQVAPTYIKIRRDYIDMETLRYFGLPWEFDAVGPHRTKSFKRRDTKKLRQGDTNYVVILQELDSHETDLLFEHTRKLRRGNKPLLTEDRDRGSEDRSRSSEDRSRSREGRPEYGFVRLE